MTIRDIQQLSDSIEDHRSCNHIDSECTSEEIASLVNFNLQQIEYILERVTV